MHNSGELYSLQFVHIEVGLLSVNEINFEKIGSVYSKGGRLNRGNYSGIPANGLEASSQSRSV